MLLDLFDCVHMSDILAMIHFHMRTCDKSSKVSESSVLLSRTSIDSLN